MADKKDASLRRTARDGSADDVEGHHYAREGYTGRAAREGITGGRTAREGFTRSREAGEDDVEGHGISGRTAREGISHGTLREGISRTLKADGTEEDVEGHSMLPNPGLARQLAAARERDIQSHLKRHELEADARARKGRR